MVRNPNSPEQEEDLNSSSVSRSYLSVVLGGSVSSLGVDSHSLSTISTASTMSTPVASIVIGGETILVNSKPTAVASAHGCRHKKELREKLSESDLADLMKSATEKMSHKFTMVPPKLEDADSLKEYATLNQLIRATRERHAHYDMADVFTIVFPDDVGLTPTLSTTRPPLDLYTNYLSVTVDEVAQSCVWYATWATADTYRQNLSETFTFFRQNCSSALYHKVLERYDGFKPAEKGGPLFFKLMLDILIADNEVVAETLIKRLRGFKISSVQGENVSSTVSLVRDACERLRDILRLPQDIDLILLELYQTTSVPDFNAMFKAEASSREYAALGPQNRGLQHHVYLPSHQDVLFKATEDINDRAENGYTKYRGNWKVPPSRHDGGASLVASSGSSKATSSSDKQDGTTGFRVFSFAVLLSGVCWNCGNADHSLRNCPHPRNEKKVEANREQFRKAKAKKGSSGPGTDSAGKPTKFAPPRPDENGRRTINGVPHTWDGNRKWWKADGGSGAHTAQTNAAPAPSDGSSGDVHASLAALTRQFGSTVTALSAVASQLKNA